MQWRFFRAVCNPRQCGVDARVLIKVEGDDGGDVHPGFDDEEKCKLFQKIWRLTGTAGGQVAGLLSVANWEGNKKPWFEFCPIDAKRLWRSACAPASCPKGLVRPKIRRGSSWLENGQRAVSRLLVP